MEISLKPALVLIAALAVLVIGGSTVISLAQGEPQPTPTLVLPTPTPLPPPTAMARPRATATITPPPTPAPVSGPQAVTLPDRTNLRQGPGLDAPVVTAVNAGTVGEVVARGPLDEWLLLRIDGVPGLVWVYGTLLYVEGDLGRVPQLSADQLAGLAPLTSLRSFWLSGCQRAWSRWPCCLSAIPEKSRTDASDATWMKWSRWCRRGKGGDQWSVSTSQS